jgi:transposase
MPIWITPIIEKAMNINYMWLSARQVADHNTLARFRSKRLKGIFKDIFKQVVLLLADEGLLTLKELTFSLVDASSGESSLKLAVLHSKD